MSLKDEVTKKGLKLLSDPRVLKLMQNEQFMKAMSALVQMPGKVNDFTQEQSERFARTLRLATADEVTALKKTVSRLEAEIEELKRRPGKGRD